MQIYLVGGAVRDGLLCYPTKENDYVVVGATPKEMEAKGFTAVGKDFPVFLHPETKEEYALARTERKTSHGYQGFAFDSQPTITLEEDLTRRDLTINAIAKTAQGVIIDPHNGRKDLARKVLRHVSEAFREDPVRILRVSRFAARYHHLGFNVAKETTELMKDMVNSGEVDFLVAERIWKEFFRALAEVNPEKFILTLDTCGALKKIIPEIHQIIYQTSSAQAYIDIEKSDALLGLRKICQMSQSPRLRFATLMQNSKTSKRDLGKFFNRLAIPNDFRELTHLVIKCCSRYNNAIQLSAAELLELLIEADAIRRPARFNESLVCCQAYAQRRDGSTKFSQAAFLTSALEKIASIEVQGLIAAGFSGKRLGDELTKIRIEHLLNFKKSWY